MYIHVKVLTHQQLLISGLLELQYLEESEHGTYINKEGKLHQTTTIRLIMT